MAETNPKYSKLDIGWLVFLVVVGGAFSLKLSSTPFDLSVFMSGILCVGLIAIGRREGYLIGLYNSLSYAVLAYENCLFGEVYLNLLFFVPTGVIGYIMWHGHSTESNTVAMRRLPWKQRAIIAAVCVAGTVGLGLVLGLNPKQNTPFIDASTNVLSVVATFLMMWRYQEQWFLYIVLNVVTIVMWFLRFMNHGAAGDLMILMWSLFLLNAVFGCWRWHVGAKKAAEAHDTVTDGEVACDVA
jgi:nicotinamide mononucleotide transporter